MCDLRPVTVEPFGSAVQAGTLEAAGPTELDGDEAPRLRRGHRPRQEKQSSFASASLSKATMRAFFVLHQVIEDNIGMVRIHRGNHLHSLNMGISSRSGGC